MKFVIYGLKLILVYSQKIENKKLLIKRQLNLVVHNLKK